MTSTSVRNKRPVDNRLPLKIILASGGLLTTLVGGNMIAGRAWVNSIVPDHQIDETLLKTNSAPIPDVQPYVESLIELPDISQLPQPVTVPEFQIEERILLVERDETAEVDTSIALPSIPQIAAPVIPQRPQINTTSVDLNLAPIPQVHVPVPVTNSSSSG